MLTPPLLFRFVISLSIVLSTLSFVIAADAEMADAREMPAGSLPPAMPGPLAAIPLEDLPTVLQRLIDSAKTNPVHAQACSERLQYATQELCAIIRTPSAPLWAQIQCAVMLLGIGTEPGLSVPVNQTALTRLNEAVPALNSVSRMLDADTTPEIKSALVEFLQEIAGNLTLATYPFHETASRELQCVLQALDRVSRSNFPDAHSRDSHFRTLKRVQSDSRLPESLRSVVKMDPDLPSTQEITPICDSQESGALSAPSTQLLTWSSAGSVGGGASPSPLPSSHSPELCIGGGSLIDTPDILCLETSSLSLSRRLSVFSDMQLTILGVSTSIAERRHIFSQLTRIAFVLPPTAASPNAARVMGAFIEGIEPLIMDPRLLPISRTDLLNILRETVTSPVLPPDLPITALWSFHSLIVKLDIPQPIQREALQIFTSIDPTVLSANIAQQFSVVHAHLIALKRIIPLVAFASLAGLGRGPSLGGASAGAPEE